MESFKVAATPGAPLALTNKVWFNPADFKRLFGDDSVPRHVQFEGMVFRTGEEDKVDGGCIALSGIQREICNVAQLDMKEVTVFDGSAFQRSPLSSVTLTIDFFKAKGKRQNSNVDGAKLMAFLQERYSEQIFTAGQKFMIQFPLEKEYYTLAVDNMEMIKSKGDAPQRVTFGMMAGITTTYFSDKSNPNIKITGAPKQPPQLFKKELNLEKLGIGGLNIQFGEIFRRAFSTRMFPTAVIEKMGIKHVKGVLLYGPPGTGKTLIARKIGEMLNAREPKIINGPEILNKYVGESEAKLRELFADADAEYAEKGDDSDLHILIFDEIDAICKQRGSGKDGTGVGDTVVNQMLSKMDGVTAINNILIVGMTNRKDMIDEALLRSGRFEVHIEVGLPDEDGRNQILKIHTNKLRDAGMLEDSFKDNLADYARETKNYSGAELEGVVKSACSYALDEKVNLESVSSGKGISAEDMNAILVTHAHFTQAMDEVRPAFGSETDVLNMAVRLGITPYGERFDDIKKNTKLFVDQIRDSATPLMSVLFEGDYGSGKTALAAHIALESGFPFVKMISPDLLLGYSESRRCDKISKIFEDAYKSPCSLIILDQIERLLEYVPIGPRFSNAALQTILVHLKREPPKGRKLLVIGTTSTMGFLSQCECDQAFSVVTRIPNLDQGEIVTVFKSMNADPNPAKRVFAPGTEEACAVVFGDSSIGIKKLFLVVEMAKQDAARLGKGSGLIDPECMSNCVMAVGL